VQAGPAAHGQWGISAIDPTGASCCHFPMSLHTEWVLYLIMFDVEKQISLLTLDDGGGSRWFRRNPHLVRVNRIIQLLLGHK
jgi:hypothetical protein